MAMKSNLNIEDLMFSTQSESVIYYIHGRYSMDLENLALIDILKGNSRALFLQSIDCSAHKFFFLDPEFLFSIHSMLVNYRKSISPIHQEFQDNAGEG